MTTSTASSPAPTRPASAAPARRPVPRRVRRLTTDDWLSLWGSVLASLALVTVVYEHILDGSGTLGFLVCWYLGFLVIFSFILSLSNSRPVVVDRLVTSALWVASGVVVLALASTIGYTLGEGWTAFRHLNFFTQTMAGVAPTAPLTQGGVLHAIVGTLVETGIATVFAVPVGVATAVYMSEVGGRLSNLVRTIVEAMTALPEILAGLFVYVVLIIGLGLPKSGIAVSAAMAVTMVPIIARASEVALRVVPGGLREASYALGASQWATVRKVVLPSARAGLATASILGVARAIGEIAVPLICSGASTFMVVNPTKNWMNSLPLFILTSDSSHETAAISRAFGAASVLLFLVLILFATARVLSREKTVRR